MGEEKTMDEVEFEVKTVLHQYTVAKLLMQVAQELLQRAGEHDASKLKAPEREKFLEATKGLAGLTYGSPEYKEALKGLGPALKHHYLANRHHPEHYGALDHPRETRRDPVGRMNLVDVVEMFCDWAAATKRHDDGDLLESLKINRERFGVSDQLTRIFENTAMEMGWLED